MFDIGWSEMLIIGVVALVVIGPKELPGALKTFAFWMRQARKLAREFQAGVDDMIRQAELNEAKKMPLLDHLIELRQRLFYGAAFVLVAFFGCWFISNDILLFLMQPLDTAWFAKFHEHLPRFIYTSLTEPFFVRVKLSF